jgi:hypothetical protein
MIAERNLGLVAASPAYESALMEEMLLVEEESYDYRLSMKCISIGYRFSDRPSTYWCRL